VRPETLHGRASAQRRAIIHNGEKPMFEEPHTVHCPACNGCLQRAPEYHEAGSRYLYCSGCPCRVEVRLDDARAAGLSDSALAARLAPCECGGRFTADALRRCLFCGALLSDDARGWDVWPCADSDEEQQWDQTEEFELIHRPSGKVLIRPAAWLS
jgi:hypothetical protein